MRDQRPGVVGYVRVSSTEQALEGISLAAQRAQITAYARLHNLRLLRIYTDEAISATKRAPSTRPAAQEVLDLVRQREVDGIVIVRLDRMCRSVRDALDLAEACKRGGVAWHAIHEKLDTTTAIGAFFFHLVAALAELESRRLGERTSAALKHLRSIGRMTGGRCPYGYTVRRRREGQRTVPWLVPDRRERAMIRLARRLRAAGHSLRDIGAEFERRRLPTKTGGSKWHPELVRTLVNAASSA